MSYRKLKSYNGSTIEKFETNSFREENSETIIPIRVIDKPPNTSFVFRINYNTINVNQFCFNYFMSSPAGGGREPKIVDLAIYRQDENSEPLFFKRYPNTLYTGGGNAVFNLDKFFLTIRNVFNFCSISSRFIF